MVAVLDNSDNTDCTYYFFVINKHITTIIDILVTQLLNKITGKMAPLLLFIIPTVEQNYSASTGEQFNHFLISFYGDLLL